MRTQDHLQLPNEHQSGKLKSASEAKLFQDFIKTEYIKFTSNCFSMWLLIAW